MEGAPSKARKRPLSVLVIVNAFDPDRGGGAATFNDFCFALAEKGATVTVMTPVPFYPEWTDKTGRNGWRIHRDEVRGVDVRRFGMYIPKNPQSFVQRLLFEGSLLLSYLRGLPLARQADVVVAYCPHAADVALARIMKLLFGKPTWLNVQDLAISAASSTGIDRLGTARALRGLEGWLFNAGDVWSTISTVMRDRLSPLRRRGQPLLLVPNWPDRELVEALALARDAAAAPPAPGTRPLRLLYAGNLGAKQDLTGVCRVLAASDLDFEFRVFASGSGVGALEACLAELDDRRFHLGAFLDVSALAREMAWCDLYVITEKPNIDAAFFPSKAVTAMVAETPILAICDAGSPLGREMTNESPGLHLEWADLARLPGILDRLRREAEPQSRLAGWRRNARRRAGYYDRQANIDAYCEALRRLAEGQDARELTPADDRVPS